MAATTPVETPTPSSVFSIEHSVLFQEVVRQSNGGAILIAGCGGGYDIYSGLPLYAALEAKGLPVHLANLTFTSDLSWAKSLVSGCLWEASPSPLRLPRDSYQPEFYLSQFLSQRAGKTVPVYTIARQGPAVVKKAYKWLLKNLNLSTIVLVDGGTDSLMKGDERGLGTPEEDLSSIAAVYALQVPPNFGKYLACLGWGVDAFHGVNHNLALENISELVRSHPDAYFGAFSVLPLMPEFQLLKSASEYAWKRMSISIVAGSVIHAIEGKFGDYSFTHRTGSSELFLNPLMGLLWGFRLEPLAKQHLFVTSPAFLKLRSLSDVNRHILSAATGTRKPTTFPH